MNRTFGIPKILSGRAAFLLSIVIVAICYANSLPNDFVYDDPALVASNQAIRSVSPVEFLKTPYWAGQHFYRPLTVFSSSARVIFSPPAFF